ncbi:MAG: DUF222 domain-containing protein [Pseudonocardiaceae bacterium]
MAGSDLVEVLHARARQLAHEQAKLLAVMAEIGWCDPDAEPDEVARLAQLPNANESLVPAADEIRAALAWTRNAAYREYHFAQFLLRRLPTVFTALNNGAICRSKAWLFNELCAELTEEQAQTVAERLLPKAGRLTTGELAARIKKIAIALDPEWAARRYAAAVRDRDVIGYLDENGTATVTGRRLPADQARRRAPGSRTSRKPRSGRGIRDGSGRCGPTSTSGCSTGTGHTTAVRRSSPTCSSAPPRPTSPPPTTPLRRPLLPASPLAGTLRRTPAPMLRQLESGWSCEGDCPRCSGSTATRGDPRLGCRHRGDGSHPGHRPAPCRMALRDHRSGRTADPGRDHPPPPEHAREQRVGQRPRCRPSHHGPDAGAGPG